MTQLLEVQNLTKHFPVKSGLLLRQTGMVHAVDDVSLAVAQGETLGLVGESGCGKSTLGRTVIRIYDPTSGSVRFNGADIAAFDRGRMFEFRRNVQMVFQDPYGSLNPRMTVSGIIDQPLRVHGLGSKSERRLRITALLERVGLGGWAQNRYPHEFSGGQRQRIAIARAIALHPKLVIADEPVSALDVSVQSQILNLLKDLQEELGMAYLFIAHDLAVVKHMSDRIAVMYLGKIVEQARREILFQNPKHPYTKALLAANPIPGEGHKRRSFSLQGDVPSPMKPPPGCRFHPRCPYAMDECRIVEPKLENHGQGDSVHLAACHLLDKHTSTDDGGTDAKIN